ncbi:MAG: T9SS type A sorting domain-containing protein [Bacteroidota bacterium]
MKKVYSFFAMLTALLLCGSLFAQTQDWVQMMQDPTVNFYDVQKAFNIYYTAKKQELEQSPNAPVNERGEVKVPGFKQYKRWEWFQAPRVGPNGERFNPGQVWQEMQKYDDNYGAFQAGNWTFIGPSNTSTLAGAGRLNFVRLHPTNPNTIFVGSPSGGLWVSTDGGQTWSTNTDNLPQVIGCTDVAFDPVNPNIMYMATGDGDAGDNYSVGILKSTDGGVTWSTTGLVFGMGQYKQISKILVDPNNGNNIVAATSAGIYRSTDAGATWTNVQQGSFKDMEFMPGTPTTMYACGTSFYRTTNNGASWTQITAGLPSATLLQRMAIAVTAADPQRIYLVAMKATTYDMYGVYRSTNGGTSFTTLSTNTPNIGNQGWYDLAIAANPTNALEVMLAGQTQFLKSINGGTSWTTIGTTTHVDYHDIVYTSGTTAYVASDGGIYRTTNNGTSFTNLNNNLAISQMYGFGQSATTNNLLITGWQDNGTNRYNGTWSISMGGDGMLCFISRTNNNNMWAEYYNGAMNRSTNGGASFSPCATPPGTGAWVTPWKESPTTGSTIYCGFQNLFRSTNGGVSWTALGTLPGLSTETVNQFAISPANTNVIWVSKGSSLYLTTNNGTTWTQITNIPPGNISYIACHNTDVNRAWITYSGFTNTDKVFQTTNQGASWTNLSASLPNIPVNCILYQAGSNNGLYIGTDCGVFYKDATMNVWQPFSTGLPNVVVTQIEDYAAGSKLRCSTYGRGMWESPYYVPGSYAPVANFGASATNACPGASITFTDWSAGQPTSWNWSFPGGTPSTSTAQNPVVSYSASGTYTVTLTVTNGNGSDTKTVTGYIVIASGPTAPTTTGDQVCAPGGIVNLTATPSQPGTVRWWNAPGGGSIVNTGTTYNPNITATTTWYVDESFPTGSPGSVGPTNNSMGTGAMFTANDIRGLYFDVLSPIVLNTVDVYCNSDGNRTIEVIDAMGNTYADTTIYIFQNPTIPIAIDLNFTLYPGTYFIKCRGLVDLWRNSAGAVYPYTSPSVNITNSNAGTPGYYYYFYNWQYTNIVCNTNRTPVTGTVITCTGMEGLFAEGSFSVYPNPNNGSFEVNFTADNTDNYTVTVTNTIGEVVYEDKVENFAGNYARKIDLMTAGKGVYLLTVSNGKHQSVKKVIVF